MFTNTNLPAEKIPGEKEIKKLCKSFTAAFRTNVSDRYKDRATDTFGTGQYSVLSQMYFAEFLKCYFFNRDLAGNDNQPVGLTDSEI